MIDDAWRWISSGRYLTAPLHPCITAMMHMIGEGVFDPQMPNLRRRPSEIIRSEQLVLTCESEESGLDRVLEAARDLRSAQKERILGRNAVEFFGLGNLPEPNALKTARSGWPREEPHVAHGALR